MDAKIRRLFQERLTARSRVRDSVPAKRFTTFGLGASVPLVIDCNELQDLETFKATCAEHGLAYRMLGAGSNVVLPDEPLRDIIVRFSLAGRRFLHASVQACSSLEQLKTELAASDSTISLDQFKLGESVKLRVFANTPLMSFSEYTCSLGLSGLEFAAGIPASVGGAVAMNAGAHGSSMSDVLRSVYLLDDAGRFVCLDEAKLRFSYRNCELPKNSIVLAADFVFRLLDASDCKATRAKCLEYRKRTQPLSQPSAGSVFKNVECDISSELAIRYGGESSGDYSGQRIVVPVGWILERLDLKGFKSGGVQFSDLHANWLVKMDQSARSEDVRTLVSLASNRVLEEFGVKLETEIRLWP